MIEILEAVQEGDEKRIIKMLDGDPELRKCRDENGRTLLSWACQLGYLTIVKILIAKGADINSRDINKYYKSTPLHEAISEGHLLIAKLLIEQGADVSIEDNDFQTPLYILANNIAFGFSEEGSKEIINLLIEAGDKIDCVPIAASVGTFEDVKRMIDDGNDPDERFNRGSRTALHVASACGNIQLVDYLLSLNTEGVAELSSNKVDVNATDDNDLTPLDLASNNEISDIVKRNGGKTGGELEDYFPESPPLIFDLIKKKL